MKVIVMGAGINGVLSAYFLALKGYEVVVLERGSELGAGCSYANGGQLSFSHIEPFSSKASFWAILRAILRRNSFLAVDNKFSADNFGLFYKFARNYGDFKARKIAKKLFALGQESRLALAEILAAENIDFDYKNEGILHFFSSKGAFEAAKKQADFQNSLGDDVRVMSAQECLEKEPVLQENRLLGGVFHGGDASGDALKFARALTKICQEKYGVKFVFDCNIRNILSNGRRITGINAFDEVYVGDAYVCALGAYGGDLLRGVGVVSEIFAVKGYSLSIPCDEEFLAPNLALTDPENKIVYSRLGNVFRAAGAVEICQGDGFNERLIEFLKSKIRASFSDFGNIEKAEIWRGDRPFRPDCLPLIGGVSKYPNLFLNFGHGHLGWTMSAGSGKMLSREI